MKLNNLKTTSKIVAAPIEQNTQHQSELAFLKEKLSKDIDRLVLKSKCFTSHKMVIEHIAGALCNQFFSKELWADRKPFAALTISALLYTTSFIDLEPDDLDAVINLTQQVEQLFIKSKPFEDIFSELMGPLCGKDNSLKQNFTPKSVANAATRFMPVKYVKGKPFYVADATGCGAGNLILAQMHQFYIDNGADAMTDLHVIGLDIDLDLVRMSIVQIMSHSLVHGINLGGVELHYGDVIREYYENTRVFSHTYCRLKKNEELVEFEISFPVNDKILSHININVGGL